MRLDLGGGTKNTVAPGHVNIDLVKDADIVWDLNKGLPPGPICNPGKKAISAVINQDQNDFWFYATGDDGVTRFTKTLGEHNQNVDKNIKN